MTQELSVVASILLQCMQIANTFFCIIYNSQIFLHKYDRETENRYCTKIYTSVTLLAIVYAAGTEGGS